MSYTEWINSQIEKYSTYPTSAPPQFVSDTKYDERWRICPQIKSIAAEPPWKECDNRGSALGCGYSLDCQVCIPASQTDIYYTDCFNIQEKINRVKNITATGPPIRTPTRTSTPTKKKTIYKKYIPK